jgi:hypothetical protein
MRSLIRRGTIILAVAVLFAALAFVTQDRGATLLSAQDLEGEQDQSAVSATMQAYQQDKMPAKEL